MKYSTTESQTHILLLLCGLLALSVFSCDSREGDQQAEHIARVGNEYLSLEQAKEAIPSFIYKEDSAAALDQYRQQWIQRKLVLREAGRMNLGQQEEIQQRLQQARDEILREALRTHIVTSEVDTAVSEQEVEAYYEENKEHFMLGEAYVQYRHLKTQEIEDARTAKRALQSGSPWEEVADNYAMEPPDAIDNARKFHPISEVLDDNDIMRRYLQTMNINEISPIQRVNSVYQFVQLTGRREQNEAADKEWVMDKVKNWIILDKRQRKFNSYLKNLYLKAESNNEIDVYNVIPAKPNSKKIPTDSLESNSTDE